MKEATAAAAKNRFGQIIGQAMSESVAIDRHGWPVAVLLSFAEYQRLFGIKDSYWEERVGQALRNGFDDDREGRSWPEGKL